MERFNALPTPQKLGVMVGSMALLVGLFYYSTIMDFDDQRANNETQKQLLSSQVDKLKKEVKDNKLAPLKKKNEELLARQKGFERQLPRAEDLERFITGISQTARNSGLELLSFKKGRPIENHYYQEVPIEMAVQGTYRELIGFMRAVSKEGQRVINLRNLKLELEKLPIDGIVGKFEQRRREATPEGVEVKDLDPVAKQMQLVRAHEEVIANGVQLKANFVAYVFSYTGVHAGKNAAARIKSKKSLFIIKRKEMVAL